MSVWTMSPARGWGRRVIGRRGWQLAAPGAGGPRVVVARPSRDPATVRVTARGRLVLAGAAVVLGALGALVGMSNAAAGGNTSAASEPGFVPVSVPVAAESTVVVRSADTLWTIAARTFPGADPREAVVAFRQANGGRIESLQVGQRLTVPSRL